MLSKVVMTCALTGGFDTTSKNPAVPVTPEQIAKSGLDAAQAGAAVLHIHVRDPETGKPSMAVDLYKEAIDRIRARNSDVIINLTSGPGARFIPGEDDPLKPAPGTTLTTPERRMEHIELLRPDICSLDVGSMNFGPHVFINTPSHLADMALRAKRAKVKPEIEVFDLGHIELAKKLIADGAIESPPLFQICLGIAYGAPSTTDAMMAMRNALPADANWSGFGIGRMQFPMVAQAILLGGHVRVGLEDNLYLTAGELAPSNAALVEKAARIVEAMGSSLSSPIEARSIFGVRDSA